MIDETNNIDEQRTDPADALADLADNGGGEIVVPDEAEEIDPLSALDAMARSEDDDPDPGEFAAVASDATADDVADEVFSGGSSPLGDSGRLHVTAGAGYHRHHARMYKKTMIPLMLVVGAMLVVIGLISAAMVLNATPEQKFAPRMKLVLFVSFPLAAVVLAGAWWFHRDVNRKN